MKSPNTFDCDAADPSQIALASNSPEVVAVPLLAPYKRPSATIIPELDAPDMTLPVNCPSANISPAAITLLVFADSPVNSLDAVNTACTIEKLFAPPSTTPLATNSPNILVLDVALPTICASEDKPPNAELTDTPFPPNCASACSIPDVVEAPSLSPAISVIKNISAAIADIPVALPVNSPRDNSSPLAVTLLVLSEVPMNMPAPTIVPDPALIDTIEPERVAPAWIIA